MFLPIPVHITTAFKEPDIYYNYVKAIYMVEHIEHSDHSRVKYEVPLRTIKKEMVPVTVVDEISRRSSST